MRIDKPLWHEDLILNQQHFQQQDQRVTVTHGQFAPAAIILAAMADASLEWFAVPRS